MMTPHPVTRQPGDGGGRDPVESFRRYVAAIQAGRWREADQLNHELHKLGWIVRPRPSTGSGPVVTYPEPRPPRGAPPVVSSPPAPTGQAGRSLDLAYGPMARDAGAQENKEGPASLSLPGPEWISPGSARSPDRSETNSGPNPGVRRRVQS